MALKEDKLLLQLTDMRKSYGAVEVLHGVSLSMGAGEVLGVVGENGAGKSTLIKCLNGMTNATSGEIVFDGVPLSAHGVSEAVRLGIITIPQEFNLVNDLTVADNVFLGREPRGRFGLLDVGQMRRRTAELLSELGASVDVDSLAGDLSVPAKQMVEVAKAMACSCRLLIMDEPSTVLNQDEVETLFKVIRKLKARGASVIYISHKLREVLEICDNVAVLRDGELISFGPVAGLDESELARRMVGRNPSQMFTEKVLTEPNSEPALEVEGLEVTGLLQDVSFTIGKGEVLGFAGLVGAGRTELAETIYGIRHASKGRVMVFGREVKVRSPRQALDAGLAYLSEDRQGSGILTDFSLGSNVTMSSLEKYCHPFISRNEVDGKAGEYIKVFQIKASGPDAILGDLSGGNQQKAAIAKGLDTDPKVFIFDEPTRGIDIKAKSEVYSFINDLLRRGMACMLISSDLEEVMGLCSRVAVMREGRIAGILSGGEITAEKIMYLATGIARAETPQETKL